MININSNMDNISNVFHFINSNQNHYIIFNNGIPSVTDKSQLASSIEEVDQFVQKEILVRIQKTEKEYKLLQVIKKYYQTAVVLQEKPCVPEEEKTFNIITRLINPILVKLARPVKKSQVHLNLETTYKKLKEQSDEILKILVQRERDRKKVLDLNFIFSQQKTQFISKIRTVPFLNEAFNGIAKDVVDPEIRKIPRGYGWLAPQAETRKNASRAIHLLNRIVFGEDPSYSEQEFNELFRLCRHRYQFYLYTAALDHVTCGYRKIETLIEEIQSHIDLLTDETSPKILVLEDGSTTFTLPGGWPSHFVSYEFRKEKNGYYFILHNGGQKVDDKRLHNDLIFRDPQTNQEYGKATVRIKTTKKMIRDPSFIRKLLLGYINIKNPIHVYDKICEHFIESNKGLLEKSVVESQLEEIHQNFSKAEGINKEKLYLEAIELMKKDKSFHPLALYSTCIASNSDLVEQGMASASTLKKLEFFHLAKMTNRVALRLLKEKDQQNLQVLSLLKKLGNKKLLGYQLDHSLKLTVNPLEIIPFLKGLETGQLSYLCLPKMLKDIKEIRYFK